MANRKETAGNLPLSDRATLSLISTLEKDAAITQRTLATRLGVALGMTNTLLKRAINKGLLKVKEAPAKRFAYYVTPKGFHEKSRLVAEYLTSSLSFFRQAKSEYSLLFSLVKEQKFQKVALFGISDLAEISMMSAHSEQFELQGMIDLGNNLNRYGHISMFNSIQRAKDEGVEAVVLTSAKDSQEAYNMLIEHFSADQIFTPPLLHVTEKVRES